MHVIIVSVAVNDIGAVGDEISCNVNLGKMLRGAIEEPNRATRSLSNLVNGCNNVTSRKCGAICETRRRYVHANGH